MISPKSKKLMEKYKGKQFTIGNSMRCPVHCSCNSGIFKDLEIIETPEVVMDEDDNIKGCNIEIHSTAVCILCEKKIIRREMYIKPVNNKGGKGYVK